ncbi:MAG: hypothetical protein IIA87_05425 [Nanoarchaeota archaeon]|nr:hypothetical protein [Nanoarchaeota archaeon]
MTVLDECICDDNPSWIEPEKVFDRLPLPAKEILTSGRSVAPGMNLGIYLSEIVRCHPSLYTVVDGMLVHTPKRAKRYNEGQRKIDEGRRIQEEAMNLPAE